MADKLKATGEQAKKIGSKKKLTPAEYREIAGLAPQGGDKADEQAPPSTDEIVDAIAQAQKTKKAKSPSKPRKRTGGKLVLTEEQAAKLGLGEGKEKISADEYRKAMGLDPRASKNVPELDLSSAGMLGVAYKKGDKRIDMKTVFQRPEIAGTMGASASFSRTPRTSGTASASSWVNNYNLGTLSPPQADAPIPSNPDAPVPPVQTPRVSEGPLGRSAANYLARIAGNTGNLTRSFTRMDGTLSRMSGWTGKMASMMAGNIKDKVKKQGDKDTGWGGTLAMGGLTAALSGLVGEDDPTSVTGALYKGIVPEQIRNGISGLIGKDNIKKYGPTVRNVAGMATGLSATGINPLGLLGNLVGGGIGDIGKIAGGAMTGNPMMALMGLGGLGLTAGAVGAGAKVATSDNPIQTLVDMFKQAMEIFKKIYNGIATVANVINKHFGNGQDQLLPLVETEEMKQKKIDDAREGDDQDFMEGRRPVDPTANRVKPSDGAAVAAETNRRILNGDYLGAAGNVGGYMMEGPADGLRTLGQHWGMDKWEPEKAIKNWWNNGITTSPDDPHAVAPADRQGVIDNAVTPSKVGAAVADGMRYVTSKDAKDGKGLLPDVGRALTKTDDDPGLGGFVSREAREKNLRRYRASQEALKKQNAPAAPIVVKQGDTHIHNAAPAASSGGGGNSPGAGSVGTSIDPFVLKMTGMKWDPTGP